MIRSTLAALALALATAGPALAADHRTSLMLWGSALEGSVGIGSFEADLDLSLEEIIDVLDGSFALRHEARGSERGWYAELVYNDLKREATGAAGERQLNMQQTIVEFGLSQPLGGDWDLYGGARWETLEHSIDFTAAPSVGSSVDWADAVLGVRWQRRDDRNRLWARGDVAGGGSDGALLLEAGGAWSFAARWSFVAAYRALDTNHDDGGNRLDLLQSGAIIGIEGRW